ncbi:MAG: VWA domain-containing protein, partial [Oscillibacter sp.]|nr:VWA domain-containing protein [Oscillibacter sp.]
MKRRFWAGLLSFVMLWSLLPASALAEEESVRYGRYNDNGVWAVTNDTGKVTETGVEGVKSVSKTAEKKGDNTYEVTLKVEMEQTTTTEQPGAAATVLVMDVSGSMDDCTLAGHRHTDDCYAWERKECTKDVHPDHYKDNRHKEWFTGCKREKDGKYYYSERGALTCGQPEHTHNSNCPIKLTSAKNAAISFIQNYGGWTMENGTLTPPSAPLSRYVSIVPFSTDAAVKQDWVDVSTEQGYNQAKDAINALKADGGTNLYAGMRLAGDQLNSSKISSVSADAKNVIALTDGEPTYYEEYWEGDFFYEEGWYRDGAGSYCDQDTYDKTIERATELKKSAPLYTVCFGVADQKMCKDIDLLGNKRYYDITVGEYLKTKIATSDVTAYNADNAEQLMQAFKAITNTITTGLNAGTVTDSLPAGVSTTDGAFVNGSMTWDLNANDAKKQVDTVSGKTTYTWTKRYTVTIDPTQVAADTPYQPLNNPTTLKVTVDGQEKKVAFPIPAGKVTPLTTLTVTATGYEGTYDGKDHGKAATASIPGAKIEYSTDNGTTWNETVPTIKNVGETKVLVRATLNGYADAEDEYTLKVNYAPVTVKADNKTVELGSPAPGYTATVTGLVNDEPKSLIEYDFSCDYTENASAGERLPITVTGDEIQGNYTVTYENGWLDVDQILPDTADVEVRFYKDSVDEANRLNVTDFYMKNQVVDSEIKLGFPVIDMFRPEGYDGGVQQGDIPYIVQAGTNVIKVLYTKTEIPTTAVVVDKVIEGVDEKDIASVKGFDFNVEDLGAKEVTIAGKGSVGYDADTGRLTNTAIELKAGSYVLSEDLSKAMSAIPGYELVGVRFVETFAESEPDTQAATDDTATTAFSDYRFEIKTSDSAIFVTCINTYEKKEVEPDTYTVTYTDGVNGTAFANQVYTVHAGDKTPAFNGTPTRSGYTFTGWTPALAETVTGNATYTAQWNRNSSGDDSDTYSYVVKKVDAQDGHVLKDAKFGLYVDDK